MLISGIGGQRACAWMVGCQSCNSGALLWVLDVVLGVLHVWPVRSAACCVAGVACVVPHPDRRGSPEGVNSTQLTREHGCWVGGLPYTLLSCGVTGCWLAEGLWVLSFGIGGCWKRGWWVLGRELWGGMCDMGWSARLVGACVEGGVRTVQKGVLTVVLGVGYVHGSLQARRAAC